MEDIQSALTSRVSFTDLRGAPLASVPRGEPFTITVAIENAIGKEPPSGLYLNGWLRQQSQRNLDCQSAARAYLATGRTPIGSINLNGPVIGVLTEEGHLTLADPDLDLASANLIGATSFDELPAAFVADPDTHRYFVSLGQSGKVLAVNSLGAQHTVLADELNNPGTLVPAGYGAVWVLEHGSGDVLKLHPDGSHTRRALNATSMSGFANGHSIVVWNETDVHVLSQHNGEPLIDVLHIPTLTAGKQLAENAGAVQQAGVSPIDAITIDDESSTIAIAILTGDSLSLHYLDAPTHAIHIALGSPAHQLAVDPSGRYLFAYSPQGGDTSIIDIARGRLVQVVGADSPVINIDFTDNAAFLMLSDQSMVGVIELASIKAGQHAQVREVALGQATHSSMPDKLLLAALSPRSEMLAVHATSFTGFVIHETSAMGDAPPMSAIKLRGGVPHQIRTLDRSFQEVSTGTFSTSALLPSHGQYELVVTTGIGSLSACIPVPIEGVDAVDSHEPGTISILATTEGTAEKRLRLQQADGQPARRVQAEVTFSALEANWLIRAELETDNQGISRSSYQLPPLGEYVITVSTATAREFKPLLFQVK